MGAASILPELLQRYTQRYVVGNLSQVVPEIAAGIEQFVVTLFYLLVQLLAGKGSILQVDWHLQNNGDSNVAASPLAGNSEGSSGRSNGRQQKPTMHCQCIEKFVL